MKISRDDVLRVADLAYLDLSESELAQVRTLGERFCRPVVRSNPEVAVN